MPSRKKKKLIGYAGRDDWNGAENGWTSQKAIEAEARRLATERKNKPKRRFADDGLPENYHAW